MRLAPAAFATDDGMNALPGRILSSVFVGTGNRYQVQLANGKPVRVDVPVGSGIDSVPGDEVVLGWRPEDARLFRGEWLEP
ncbi:MAG: TOBE domain-containing protein [Betaproteobacteria bacterium]|nr:TOBE domain-containing protein [Betaproteobacteria bacterium]